MAVKKKSLHKKRIAKLESEIDECYNLIRAKQSEIGAVRKQCPHDEVSHDFDGVEWDTKCVECGALL